MRWTGSGQSPVIALYTPTFPVGAVAQLAESHTDYTGKTVNRYILKSNGHWLTDPGGNEYFTSFANLITQRSVAQVVAPDGRVLWPAEQAPSNGQAAPAVETVKPIQPSAELPAVSTEAAKKAVEAVAQGAMTAAQAATAIDEGSVMVPHPRKKWVLPAVGVGVLVLGGLFGWLVTRK